MKSFLIIVSLFFSINSLAKDSCISSSEAVEYFVTHIEVYGFDGAESGVFFPEELAISKAFEIRLDEYEEEQQFKYVGRISPESLRTDIVESLKEDIRYAPKGFYTFPQMESGANCDDEASIDCFGNVTITRHCYH